MEDKRITKTKQGLKQTLIALAAEKPFEQITVTELCKAADVSRITFYAHYSDKYELVDEVFRDMRAEASRVFHRLERENNPTGNRTLSYCNLLDCILDVYYGQSPFFAHATPQDSPYLYYSLHHYITRNVENYARRVGQTLAQPYTLRQITAFLCNGLWGFIEQCRSESCSLEETRAQAKSLLRSVLESGALTH